MHRQACYSSEVCGLGISKERLAALFGVALLSCSSYISPVLHLCRIGLCGFALDRLRVLALFTLRAPERSVVRMRAWIRRLQLLPGSALAGTEPSKYVGMSIVAAGGRVGGGESKGCPPMARTRAPRLTSMSSEPSMAGSAMSADKDSTFTKESVL